MQVEFFVAGANFLFCVQRLVMAFKSRRLSALVWALAAYFSFFFIFVILDGPFSKYRGFTGDTLYVRQHHIDYACYYITFFHLIFAVSERVVWKFLGVFPDRITWELPRYDRRLSAMRGIFFALLAVGGVLYWWQMRSLGYRDYVEYAGSNWSMVFLWASSPFITISMMQRRYWSAVLAAVPFVIFAVMLHVRSFALLSAIPAVMIGYVHLWGHYQNKRRLFSMVLAACILSGGLLGLSAVIMYQKGGHLKLPDSDMVYGTAIIIAATKHAEHHTGFNSLEGYGLNFVNPFFRLFGIERPKLIDTPVYMASLVDGVPKDWPVYYHYPTLWYADSFISFGGKGLVLAAFWALILTIWEVVILRYPAMIALMLPYYSWHTYMLIRGTPAIASVPFSYAFYISAMVLFAFGGRLAWATPVRIEPPIVVSEEALQEVQ